MWVAVNVPQGIYADLEEQLQTTYSLKEAVVVDSVEHDDQILRDKRRCVLTISSASPPGAQHY